MEIGVYCMNMHHGIGLEAFLGRPFPPGLAISTETMAAVADFAEDARLDSLWFGDHVIFPSRTASPHPSSGHMDGADIRVNEPVFDPLAVMSWLGARAERVRLGFSVLVIPYRNPVVMAKFLSSLDVLTDGRIILGTGVGMMEEEFDAVDASFKDRGPVTDEYLQVMRELWTAEHPVFDGQHYRLPADLHFLPKPVNGTIPVWIGGSTKRALRRAAHLGDGWLAVYQTHDEIRTKWDQLQQLAAAEDRDPGTLTLAHQMRFFVNDEPYPDAPPGVGSVSKVAEDIARFAELGVRHLELAPPPGPTTDAILRQLGLFVEHVRPQLGANV